MNSHWEKLCLNLQKHVSECPFGEVSLSLIVHSGSIQKVIIQHSEKYLDISEVPYVELPD